MTTVTAVEAKNRFGKLLARVVRGEEVVITRHEKAIARIVPEGRRRLGSVQNAVNDLRRLQQQIKARGKGTRRLSRSEVRSAIKEGRL